MEVIFAMTSILILYSPKTSLGFIRFRKKQ